MDGKLDFRPISGSNIHIHTYDEGVKPFFKYLAGSPSRLFPNGASPEVRVKFPMQSVIPVVERIFLIGPS